MELGQIANAETLVFEAPSEAGDRCKQFLVSFGEVKRAPILRVAGSFPDIMREDFVLIDCTIVKPGDRFVVQESDAEELIHFRLITLPPMQHVDDSQGHSDDDDYDHRSPNRQPSKETKARTRALSHWLRRVTEGAIRLTCRYQLLTTGPGGGYNNRPCSSAAQRQIADLTLFTP
jgi:hypothetical protein